MNAPTQALRAALWMIGAIVGFTCLAVAGRAVAFELDTFEIMLFRSLFSLAIVLVVARAAGTLGQINTERLATHGLRNISHFAGQNLWFFAITAAPLAQVVSLEFTMPIWAMFLAVVVLGERLVPARILTAAVGFSGILIITQPWAGDGEAARFGIGQIAAAAAAIGFAGSAVFTRLLTRHTTVTNILFWLALMQATLGLICAGYDGDIALPTGTSWAWIALIACAGLGAHFCLTTALSLAPATIVIPIDFARIPVLALVGMAFYDEPLQASVLLGAAVIFGANYANIWIESRASRTTQE